MDFPPDEGHTGGLMGALFKHFSDETGKLNLQRRLSSSDWQVERVESDSIDSYMELDVLLLQLGKDSYQLYLRARSTQVLKYLLIHALNLSGSMVEFAGSLGQFQVRSNKFNKLELRCLTISSPRFTTLTLSHGTGSITTLSKDKFDMKPYGWYEATIEIEQTVPLMNALANYTAAQVREGAGFTVKVDESEVQRGLVSDSNFIIGLPVFTTVQDMMLKVTAPRNSVDRSVQLQRLRHQSLGGPYMGHQCRRENRVHGRA